MPHRFVQSFVRVLIAYLTLFFISFAPATPVLVKQDSVKAKEPKPIDFFSKKKMELIKELDDIMREMIWLIRSERPTANKTLFGKVYRALQQSKGAKLAEKNKHRCDLYVVEKVTEFQYRIYEHCQKHRNPDLLAKLEWSHAQVGFEFQGQNYADVLGVAASLVAPKVKCEVAFEGEYKLQTVHCEGFRITRGENVTRFESIDYSKGKDPLMVMKGEVLRNLLPYSDLSISVPLQGKVKVVEKKKVPDIDETTPEKKAREEAMAKENQKSPIPQPVDPRKADPTKPPRDGEVDGNNGDMIKNSNPDMIEIKEPVPTR